MTQPPMSPGFQTPPPQQPSSGLATASFVVGIVAVCVSIVFFCIPPLGGLVGIVAIILGAIAMGQTKNTPIAGKARIGLILGIIAVVLSVAIFLAARAGLSFLGKSFQQKADQLKKQVEEEQKKAEERQRQHQTPSTAPDSTTMAPTLEWNVVGSWRGAPLHRRLTVELPPRIQLTA
jgi:hypothetical protein